MARICRLNTLISNDQKMTVADAYELFLQSRQTSCAKDTCQIYADLGRRVIIPDLTDLTNNNIYSVNTEQLRDLIARYERGHSQGGVRFFYCHLKAFINWFWDEYEPAGKNPIRKIKIRKPDLPPKKGITREEVDLLLEAAKGSAFPERDIAVLMILCDTGIRLSSLLNLKIDDVDLKRGEITVFEKDQNYHIKSCGSACTKAIKKYMRCLLDTKPDDPLWLKFDGCGITEEGMKQILRRLCRDAGIELHLFHDFRRFYGLELYRATKDIYFVSRALDHKDIEVTKRYLAIDKIEDAEAMKYISPMDQRKGQTGITVRRLK